MKNEKERIDELIREALSEEEAAFYDSLGERDLFGKLESVYSGKLGWLAVLMSVVQVVMFVLFIYCLIQFFNVESTNELIKWGAGGFLSLLSVTMLKLFIWMQMDKNDILLALKKLELQLVSYIERSSH